MFFLILFLGIFIPKSESQLNTSSGKGIQIGITSFIVESQLKSQLFKTSNFHEIFEFGFGGEIIITKPINQKWLIQLGLLYEGSRYTFQENFLVPYQNPGMNPKLEIERSDRFQNSISTIDSDYTVIIDQEDCGLSTRLLEHGDNIKMGFSSSNKIEVLGFPIKIERQFGDKPNKLFFQIGIAPVIVVNKKIDISDNVRGGLGERIDTAFCLRNRDVIRIIDHTEVTGWNIKNSRIDIQTQIGLLHEFRNNVLTLGVFYQESFTGYTIIEGEVYNTQQLGLKVGFRRKVFSKT